MAKYYRYAANFVEPDVDAEDWEQVDSLTWQVNEDDEYEDDEDDDESYDYSHVNELKTPRELKFDHAVQHMIEDRVHDLDKFTPEEAAELLESYNAEWEKMTDAGESMGEALTLEELYRVQAMVQQKVESGQLDDILDEDDQRAWAEACKAAGLEAPIEEDATLNTITIDDLSPGGVSLEERELQKERVLAEAKLKKKRAAAQWGEVNLLDLDLKRDPTMECLDDEYDDDSFDDGQDGDSDGSSVLPHQRELPEEPPVPPSLRAYMESDDDNLEESQDRDLQMSVEERDQQTEDLLDFTMQRHLTDGRLDYFYNDTVINEEPAISDQAYDALRKDGRFVDEKGKDIILGLEDPHEEEGYEEMGSDGGALSLYGAPKGKGRAKEEGESLLKYKGKTADELGMKPLEAAPTSYSYFVWNEDLERHQNSPPVQRRHIEDASGLPLDAMGETHSAPLGGDPSYDTQRVTIFDILPPEVSPTSVALKTVEYMGGMKMPGDDDVKYGEQKATLFVDLDGVDISEERKTFIRELCHNRLLNSGKTLRLKVDKYRFCGQNVKHSIGLLSQILDESEKAAANSASRTDPSTAGTKNLPRPGFPHGTSRPRKVRV